MKIKIPQKCNITNKSINHLKLQVKKLIDQFDKYNEKEYKIYLYSNFLKIYYKNRYYYVTVVEYNNDLFWYLKPFYKSYLLLQNTDDACFEIVMNIIETITP